ncbi:Tetratricopeptide repeat protein [Pelomyxa schiedti]|nr:Tetratricopeptide repeat protein [Pelomyxa schiedti]
MKKGSARSTALSADLGAKAEEVVVCRCFWFKIDKESLSSAQSQAASAHPDVKVLTVRDFTKADVIVRGQGKIPAFMSTRVSTTCTASDLSSFLSQFVKEKQQEKLRRQQELAAKQASAKGTAIVPPEVVVLSESTGPTPPPSPTVNMLLPDKAVCGDSAKSLNCCMIAIFGSHFNVSESSGIIIRFGDNVFPTRIEVHSSTSVVATLPPLVHVPPGDVQVSASNDGGKHFGISCTFTFYSPTVERGLSTAQEEQNLEAKLATLRRSIQQLEVAMVNVRNLEAEIIGSVKKPLSITGRQPLMITQPEPQAPIPTFAPQIESRVLQPKVDRELKIFISSTFRDMDAERNLIVKQVFPRLKQICMERDVCLTYVDLRWGLTGTASDNAATLLLCLRELSQCNVFVGMYGERYGWCLSDDFYRNPTQQDDLLKRSFDVAAKEFPWVQQLVDRSVTELEWRMVLERKTKGDVASFFFLRDPYYIQSDVPESERYLYKSEGPSQESKLSQLKVTVTKSGLPCSAYNRPSHLVDLMYEQLQDYLNKLYPEGSVLTPLECERVRHGWYSSTLRQVFVPQDKYNAELDSFASSNTVVGVCAVIGSTGMGKSALLANWIVRYNRHHPEFPCVIHHVGASASSTSHCLMLRRCLNDLLSQLGDTTDSIPKDDEYMIAKLPQVMQQIAQRNKRSKIILVLEGIDKLDDTDNSSDLLWLPKILPPEIRLIVSTTPSSPSGMELKKRDAVIVELLPLPEDSRTTVIREYLLLHGKRLTDAQEVLVKKATQTGVPRYLITLLDDILLWGDFASLNSRIVQDLKARNVCELYQLLLKRLEEDYDKSGKGVVRHSTSILWAARSGITMVELEELLAARGIDKLQWLSLFAALDSLLINSSGYLKWANQPIKEAVAACFLTEESEINSIHATLADFLMKQEAYITERKATEGVWQLFCAKQWEILANVLSDLHMFMWIFKSKERYMLVKYWDEIEKNSTISMVERYHEALSVPTKFPGDVITGDLYYNVGTFLGDASKFQPSLDVLSRALSWYSNSSQSLAVAKVRYSMGCAKITMGHFQDAERLLVKAADTYKAEQGEDSEDVAQVINRLGHLYLNMSKLSEAEQCFDKALKIRKEKLGGSHVRCAQTIRNLAHLCERKGQYEQGYQYALEAVQLTENWFGPHHATLAFPLIRLGVLSQILGKRQEAQEILDRALDICIKRCGMFHPYTAEAHHGIGSLAASNGQYDTAAHHLQQSVEITTKTVGASHPDTLRVKHRLAMVHMEMDPSKAEAELLSVLAERKRVLPENDPRIAQSHKALVTCFQLQKKYKAAIEQGEKAIAVLRNHYGPGQPEEKGVIERIQQIKRLGNL